MIRVNDSGERFMAHIQLYRLHNLRRRPAIFLLLISYFSFFAVLPRAWAQSTQGNKPPVENKMPQDTIDSSAQETTLGPPTLPVEQIIKQFAAKESEFKIERDNFTYTQTFVLQTLDESNHVDGEYRMTSDIVFDEH